MINEIRKKFIQRIKNIKTNNKFIPLNDTFSYGRAGNTLHMHLVPTDLRNMKNELGEDKFNEFIETKLEDFLYRLQSIVRDDESIKGVFAVSPIFYHENWKNIHENLGFDEIKEIVLDDSSSDMPYEQKLKFLNMFNKDKKYTKRVFYTNMSREKILNTNFHKLENPDLDKQK